VSEKTIKALAAVVWQEVERNPAFAKRVEDALGNFAIEFKARRDDEKAAGSISLSALMQEGGEEAVRKKVSKLKLSALRLVVSMNNLDPSGTLTKGGKKAAFIDIIVDGASRKQKRKSAFDY
jgi:hypothetical protein